MKSEIIHGDCIEVLREMEAGSVHCCVTSPPYWGLRDYGMDGQIGLEETPEAYTERMVDVFREVRRVLRDDGTLWLNLGDSYASDIKGSGGPSDKQLSNAGSRYKMSKRLNHGLKPKDLIGIPWRVAFALQADGWWLRSDIIWAKPNPMPESVTDRPTKSHEHIFLLSKSKKYYYDADAIREKPDKEYGDKPEDYEGKNYNWLKETGRMNSKEKWSNPGGRNKRDVWTVATAPYSEAHFATFPPKLIEPCILAGTSEKGCCPECGTPWERVVKKFIPEDKGRSKDAKYTEMGGQFKRRLGQQYQDQLNNNPPLTVGWGPSCDCGPDSHPPYQDDKWPTIRVEPKGVVRIAWKPVPCTTLDPFSGAGTTGLVSAKLKRHFIGIELNADYREMAIKRIAEFNKQTTFAF